MNNKAFTLIELIVVMAIIAVLVLLAAPRFLGYTKNANVKRIPGQPMMKQSLPISVMEASVKFIRLMNRN